MEFTRKRNPLGLAFAKGIESIEVVLGANPACARHLDGTGVPCVIYPRYKSGGYGGTGAHPGFVVEFEIADLMASGFDEDEIYTHGLGCTVATHLDPHTGEPVCEECLAAAGERGKKLPKKYAGKPCWSCAQMWDETLRDHAEEIACRSGRGNE
jgi:hypothetical protein